MSAKRRTEAKRGKERSGPKGYDFGCETLTMVVGSPDFMRALSDADVFACSYGFAYTSELQSHVPHMGLVGSKPEKLTEAFREFRRWKEASQTDPVELHFVFLEDGSYLLGVSPRFEALRRAFGHLDLVSDAVVVSGTWIKKLDTSSSAKQFREVFTGHVITPFLFGGCVHPPTNSAGDCKLNLVRPIEEAPILLFRASFIDERDAEKDRHARMMMTATRPERTSSGTNKKDQYGPPSARKSQRDYFRNREICLTRHFPVTLVRLRRLGFCTEIFEQLKTEGIRKWQIEQAMCNLLLSRSLCSGVLFYEPLNSRDLQNLVIEGLRNRIEEADYDCSLNSLPLERVRQQVMLDADYLLTSVGLVPKRADLTLLQRLLHRRGLLDARGAETGVISR